MFSVWIQYTGAQNSLEKLNAARNEVATKLDSALLQIEVLSAKLTPFIEEAMSQFPQIDESRALELLFDKTKAEIRKTLPQLKYISAKSSYGKSQETEDYTCHLVFEAVPPGVLRDMRLILECNQSILTAKSRLAGPILLGRGSKLEFNSDSTQITCFIDNLIETNSLVIDITSKGSLIIDSMYINP